MCGQDIPAKPRDPHESLPHEDVLVDAMRDGVVRGFGIQLAFDPFRPLPVGMLDTPDIEDSEGEAIGSRDGSLDLHQLHESLLQDLLTLVSRETKPDASESEQLFLLRLVVRQAFSHLGACCRRLPVWYLNIHR
jgi:hypothetical protein